MSKSTPADIAFPDARHRVQVGQLEPDMFIRVICETCDHIEEKPAAFFQERYAADVAFSDLAPRFKCKACGKVGTPFWDAWRPE